MKILSQCDIKKAFLLNKGNLTNTNIQKLKKAPKESKHKKGQLEYIQD